MQDDGDRVLFRCHAGCSQSDLLDALKGLGLWPESTQRRERRYPYYRADSTHHLTKVRIDRPGHSKRVFSDPKGVRPPHPL